MLTYLEGRPLGQQAFEILDTPGPNEAGTLLLQKKVEQVLSEADVIIYVLDYTKLKTAEEDSLFKLLKEMRPELLRRCSERLFFIVNKIDTENRNGLSPGETAAYVTKLLRRQFPSLKLTQDRIIPVAAERALLARMVAQGRPSQASLKDFRRIVFGFSKEAATLRECQEQVPSLLENSRVAELEKEILAFIYEHRGRLMLQSFLDDLSRYRHQLHNHLLAVSATLKEDHAKLTQRKKELEADLAKVTVGLQRIDDATQSFEEATEAWVRRQFSQFRTQAQSLIDQALSGGRSDGLSGKRHPFVESIWRLLKGGDSHADASRRIQEVNGQLMRALQQEFDTFRQRLEGEAHDKQQALSDQLQELINPLARRIEREVGRALKIRLTAVPLRLPELPLREFQQELQAHVDTLIQRTESDQKHVTQERYLKKKGGWCSADEYGMRDVVTSTKTVSHAVSVQKLRDLWSERLETLTETSVGTARSIVGQMSRRTLRRARTELENYAEGFLDTIEQELKASDTGKTRREKRLRAVGDQLRQLDELKGLLQAGSRELEGSSRRRQEPGGCDVFVCYDSRNRKEVMRIVRKLEARGLTTWIDFRDQRPGHSWQKQLESQLLVSRAVAVFIGKGGLDFWQEAEQQISIRESRKRGVAVIPTILAECKRVPPLPPFLDGMHRVDFRRKEPDPLEKLIHGIQGEQSGASA